MKERDAATTAGETAPGVRPKLAPPRGILHQRNGAASRDLHRYWAADDLLPFVEHYWIVRWDVEQPTLVETLPHPSVHLVIGADDAEVVGVMRRRFARWLCGRGWVVGTKFRPGGFAAFVAGSVVAYTDRRLGLAEVFGARADGLVEGVRDAADDGAAVALVEAFLRSLAPRQKPGMALVARAAERIASDPGVTRADQVAAHEGISLRQLQRLFRQHAGVSPKWVIQRYRLIEAAERVAAGATVDWADLALELGYADQAHFIRDFRRLVGRPPAAYARSLQAAQPAPPTAAGVRLSRRANRTTR